MTGDYFRSPGDDKSINHHLDDDILGQYTHLDMMYISGLTVLRDVLGQLWLYFAIRGKCDVRLRLLQN